MRANIAITGASTFLGSRILKRLLESGDAENLVAIDIASLTGPLARVRQHRIDLTEPASDQALLELLREEQIETVIHFAFFTDPQRDREYAHELESIGTLNLLAAAAAADVRHFVMRGFTAVYGARGQNPNFLTEEHALRPNTALPWARDKLEAEQHAAAFARRYPAMKVTSLRFAPLLGPGVRNFYTRLLDNRVVPVLMGFDPLVQLLHPDDALTAIDLALNRSPGGALNVVPRSPIPLRTALHVAGKVPVAVPHPVAYAASDLLWASGLGAAPAGFLDYARYLFVADGEKAKGALGFEAHYRSRESLDAYIRYRHPDRKLRHVEAEA